MKTRPISEGYNTLSPYVTVIGADKAIESIKKHLVLKKPDGLLCPMAPWVIVRWILAVQKINNTYNYVKDKHLS